MLTSLYQPNTFASLPRGNGHQPAARILNTQPPAAPAQSAAAAERERQIRVGRLEALRDHLKAELAATERQNAALRAELEALRTGQQTPGLCAWAAANPTPLLAVPAQRMPHESELPRLTASKLDWKAIWTAANPVPLH